MRQADECDYHGILKTIISLDMQLKHRYIGRCDVFIEYYIFHPGGIVFNAVNAGPISTAKSIFGFKWS